MLLTLATTHLANAQPVPTAPSSPSAAAPPLWHMDPLGPSPGIQSGQATAGYQDRNGPLLVGDRLLDYGPSIPGWLAGIDIGVVVPHIANKVTSLVTLTNGAVDPVHLPTADLDVRVMPKVELGYRLGQAGGELIFAYRFLAAEGRQTVAGTDLPLFAPGGGAALRSRLDLQVLDLDYASYEPSLGPSWDMKWRVGLRFVNCYADSQAFNALLRQQTTNRFWGVGPHAALDLRRCIADSGVALFGRMETSVPIGRAEQSYAETAVAANGQARLQQNMPILSLAFQAGVSWSPAGGDRFRLTAGYTFEHWWDLGSIGVAAGSPREELSIQGGFLRAEWNY
jgi:hypothetical protein